jgi:hypothetical protein
VVLQKGAVIAGRVLDETGEPLVDVRVMAMQKAPTPPSAVAGRERLIPTGAGGQTNDLGEFRLFSLPAGEYYVQAMPHFGGSSAARATTTLPTYFSGTADVRGAQPIAVGAGQTAGDIEIRMIGAPAFQVSGVVLDEARRPVANAMVRLTIDDPTGGPTFMMGLPHHARTDRSGTFSINNVTSGTYTLLAEAPVLISGSPDATGGVAATGGGGFTSFGVSSGWVGGTISAGVITETGNGATIQYRDDTATRVPITINQANVTGLEVIVRSPLR